jgi:enoyl-CoA hydratase
VPYQCILTDTRGRVGLVTLNRPKQLNALNDQLMDELGAALLAFDADDAIGAIVITGSDKAFAAGADIGAMAQWSYMDVYRIRIHHPKLGNHPQDPQARHRRRRRLRPGRRLRTGHDVRHRHRRRNRAFWPARDQAGVIPGAGGTQRLPRAISKAKAMDLCLTARMMDAAEAERAGLVSRVVPADKVLDEALAAAATIAEYSLPSVMMAKEAINRSYEVPLAEGILFERRVFHSLFATEDQKEGMDAFVSKRKPVFRHR